MTVQQEDIPVPMKQRVIATWSDAAGGWLVMWPDGDVERFEKLEGVHKAIERRARKETGGGGWMVTDLEIRGSAWRAAVHNVEEEA